MFLFAGSSPRAPGRLAGLLVAATLVLTVAPPAMATTRWAVPGGDSSDAGCLSKAANCSGQHALDVAQANDEVIFATGPYFTGSAGLVQNNNVPQNIHGEDGEYPPWIVVDDPTKFAFTSCFCRQYGTTIRHMGFENDGGGGALFFTGGGSNDFPTSVQDVQALGGGLGIVLFFFNAAIADAMAEANGTGGIAVDSFANVSVSGISAFASGTGGVGFQENPACFLGVCDRSPTIANIRNSVLSGGPGGADWKTTSASCGPGCTTNGVVDISSSNFRNVSDCSGCTSTQGTGNQSTVPVLVDPAGGDLHQTAQSPTIDAGADLPGKPTTDIDGDPRKVGPAPDIGADEFVPNQAPPRTNPPVPIKPPSVATTPQALLRQAFPGLRLAVVQLRAKRNRSFDVPIPCPSLVANNCSGTIAFVAGKLKLGKAPFSIRRGVKRNVTVSLSRAARKLLAAKGSLKTVAKLTVTANGVTRTTTQNIAIRGKRKRR